MEMINGGELWPHLTAFFMALFSVRARRVIKINVTDKSMTHIGPDLGDSERKWWNGAMNDTGVIYCPPSYSERGILKIDTNTDTVTELDRCVYGLPDWSNRIVKYDPINGSTSFVGRVYGNIGNGALGRDGCIYVITRTARVLKIDTTNNIHCFVGNSIESNPRDGGWGDAILGIDGCIYWPPYDACRILKYDPHSDQTSLVGNDFGNAEHKWCGGCLASDGVIYCLPNAARRIISIDPWKEYSSSLENKLEQHPEQLGCIFDPSDDITKKSNLDRAVTKFGYKKVLKALEACMPPADQVCGISNLYPFLIAASFSSIDVSVIYQLLPLVPSLVNYNNRAHNEQSGKNTAQSSDPHCENLK